MKRLLPLTAAACLLLGTLLAAGARAGEIEEALQEDALLLVKVADWTKMRKAVEATALGKILAEEDVKTYLKGVSKVIDQLVARLEKETGIKKADFEKAYGTEIAVAVTGIESIKRKVEAGVPGEDIKEVAGTGEPCPTVALLAKVGDAEAAERVNATVEKLAKGKREAAPIAWGQVKGTCIKDAEANLYVFRAGAYQAWVFGNSEKKVRAMAGSLAAGKCERSLAASADFKLCRGKLGPRADVLWYLGIKKGLEQFLPHVPGKERGKAEKVLAALGMGDLVAAAGSLTVEAPGFRTRSFLACKLKEKGVTGLLGAEPLPAEFLKLVPDKVVAMQAGAVRLDRLMPLVRKVLGAAAEGQVEEMDKALARFKEMFGFDLEKDLLGALGGRACVYALPGAAVGGNPLMGQINGLVILMDVKDAAALRKVADKLTELAKAALGGAMGGAMGGGPGGEAEPAPQPVTTFEYRGQKVTAFNIAGMAAPGFAVTDKYLVIGGNVQGVKRTIARMARGEAAPAGLVDSGAYKKAVARVKVQGACGLGYVDTATSVSGAMAGAGMVMGMLGPIMAARGTARMAVSRSNLRQTGLGCHQYAEDNDEKFPPDFKALMPDYVDNKKVFLCPSYGKHAADGFDYAYVVGLAATDPGTFILAYETVPDKGGRVNALFTDAHVERLKQEDLKKKLAEQQARMKKDGRGFKVIEPAGVARGGAPAPGGEELTEETFINLIRQMTNPVTMPPADVITKHLFPGVTVTRRVDGGILFEGFSPLGFSGGLGGGGGSPQSVATVSIVAAIAIPSLLSARRSSLETNAVGSLRAYAMAQTMFKRNDWDGDNALEYAADFAELNTTKDGAGDKIQLIDAAFAAAKGPNGPPKHGYRFYNMKTIAGKAIDWNVDFALCAVPAVYGRTGYRTFIITTNGTVFARDTAGNKPVLDYPANPAAAGWIIGE